MWPNILIDRLAKVFPFSSFFKERRRRRRRRKRREHTNVSGSARMKVK